MENDYSPLTEEDFDDIGIEEAQALLRHATPADHLNT